MAHTARMPRTHSTLSPLSVNELIETWSSEKTRDGPLASYFSGRKQQDILSKAAWYPS